MLTLDVNNWPRRPKGVLEILLGLSLLLPLAIPAWAQPPLPVDASGSEPVLLRYGLRPGESLRYRLGLSSRGTVSDITTSRSRELSLTGSLTLVLVVQQTDPEGNIIFSEEVREPSFTVSGTGFEVSARDLGRAISGVARTLKLSPRGEIVDEEMQPVTLDPAVSLFVSELHRVGETVRLEFPEEAVEIGDSWLVEETFPGNGQNFDRRASMSLTLLGYSAVGTRRCAALEVGGDVWLELPAGVTVGQMLGPALGRGVFSGYVYFDTATGRLVRAEIEVGAVGQVLGSATPLDFTDQTRWTIELVE